MKKNGFTLIEILAVLIILGLLLVLTIPAYINIFNSVKRDNFSSTISEIETAATEMGDKIKDEIKTSANSCVSYTVADLIKEGYLTSESDRDDVIYSPVDNTPLLGEVRICYCTSEYDIESYYLTEFDANTVYHIGDKVSYNDKIYECIKLYTGDGSGISSTYFSEIGC